MKRNAVIAMRKVDAEPLLWATAAHSATGYLAGPTVALCPLSEALAALERCISVERTILNGQDSLIFNGAHGSLRIYLNLTPPNLEGAGPWA
jgi:hypothetical protein